MTFTVQDLLKATKGSLISGYPTTTVNNVSIDTRTIRPGDVFFALQGPRFDGHHFLRIAAEKKAKAVVIHRLDRDLDIPRGERPDMIQVRDTLGALQDLA